MLAVCSPTRARAACTKDTECSGGLICIRGQCASSVDPGSRRGPGTIDARDRQRGACLQKCEKENSRCLSRVTSVSSCISRERNNCISTCQGQGDSAQACAKDCNSSDRRNLWEPNCTKQGDSGRQNCLVQQESCLRACGKAS